MGKKIQDFLRKYPEVLKDYQKGERVHKIRTKIINLRRQKREEMKQKWQRLLPDDEEKDKDKDRRKRRKKTWKN